jgi:hypothetical protein
MAIALVLCDDCPAFAPMAIPKLFWRVEPARDPRAITVLRRVIVLAARVFIVMLEPVIVLALTELSVSALLHVIALFTPDVST